MLQCRGIKGREVGVMVEEHSHRSTGKVDGIGIFGVGGLEKVITFEM